MSPITPHAVGVVRRERVDLHAEAEQLVVKRARAVCHPARDAGSKAPTAAWPLAVPSGNWGRNAPFLGVTSATFAEYRACCSERAGLARASAPIATVAPKARTQLAVRAAARIANRSV